MKKVLLEADLSNSPSPSPPRSIQRQGEDMKTRVRRALVKKLSMVAEKEKVDLPETVRAILEDDKTHSRSPHPQDQRSQLRRTSEPAPPKHEFLKKGQGNRMGQRLKRALVKKLSMVAEEANI